MSNWLATDESDSIFVRYSTFIIFSIAGYICPNSVRCITADD